VAPDGLMGHQSIQSPRISGPLAAVDLGDPSLYLNQELSWLAFNRRVLAQAQDGNHPLLERVKFLAIAASNLDEFFMVRVASLARHVRAGIFGLSADGRNAEQQLEAAREGGRQMLEEIGGCWRDTLRPLLQDECIRVLEPGEYSGQVRDYLRGHFNANVCPVLTPLAFDPGHPFPFISNRSRNFAVVVEHDGQTKFARVKVPDVLPRFIRIPPAVARLEGHTFAFVEDVIQQHLGELFTGVDVTAAHLFRVVREVDIVHREDEAEDLLESVGRSLRELRDADVALLEVDAAMPERILEILVENFEMPDEGLVVRTEGRLGLSDWTALTQVHRPRLKDAPFTPRTLWRTRDTELVFDQIKDRDHLVHHPFDSFTTFETFIEAAIRDPHVVAIKMTLYRIGTNSPLVDQLTAAADAGKQVTVLVELKARFDERSNIAWATRLEEAGVHVIYGLVNLKTHGKLCLVIRKEGDGIQRYVHIGTGNYNRVTAHMYTDLGLFTSHPGIVADGSDLFNYLTGYSNQEEYRKLVVAPVSLREELTELIEREAEHARAGRAARIIVKCNALTDPEIIPTLYRASQAGVRIDGIVRGMCSLRPGVPGVSDHIRIRSIVGRFLEHSRIYYFENAGKEELYIGSADLMARNLDWRVEVLCPILDPGIRRLIRYQILEVYLDDNVRASELRADGTYEPVAVEPGDRRVDAQQILMRRPRRAAPRTTHSI
jgi:polyphosphate kinase